ncbi:MAG: efflux RND transporter permease subunit [Pseudohongiellaceae bacterium]
MPAPPSQVLLALPMRRPVAAVMFFIAVALLGIFSWSRIPIELIPPLRGEQLFVSFNRPGSEPAILEREILLPLESRAGELPGVLETWGQVSGSSGDLRIEFVPGSDSRVRELELRQIAADINRGQPQGTSINVSSQDLANLSRFAMIVQVVGGDDDSLLRDFVEQQIQVRIEATPGVSRIFVNGGAPREVTVWLDYALCTALGVQPERALARVQNAVSGLRYIGAAEEHGQRLSVLLDGRPGGVTSLGNIRLRDDSPVLLRHVADIELGEAERNSVFRINGQSAVGMLIFQDEGANLVQLGQDLRSRLDSLRQEFRPYGIDFVIGFDAAQQVEDQLQRLQQLAITGFLIALLVLFMFLKQIRAVAVVAVAVPVSLLAAGAMLYLSGYTLNLITLTGLVVGVGMLVDNSIVVYEAVQRAMEKGSAPFVASVAGIRRTLRAILAASATNAVVFLPPLYIIEDPLTRGLLVNVVAAILLPLAASLLVAVGLVPLLAQRLAAPAALARLARDSERRQVYSGKLPPQRARELFSGFLKLALRQPAPWITSIFVVVLLTLVVALPWVMVNTAGQSPAEAAQTTVEVEFDGGGSLEAAGLVFARLEQAVLNRDGIARVESSYQVDQGSLTVHLDPLEERGEIINVAGVRSLLNDAIDGMDTVQLRPAVSPAGGGEEAAALFGGGASQIAVSGTDMAQALRIAEELRLRLESIPQVESVTVGSQRGSLELNIAAIPGALTAYRLNPQDVLGVLEAAGREGRQSPVGLSMGDGREIPLTLRRLTAERQSPEQWLSGLRVLSGEDVIPLSGLVNSEVGVPPPVISHHNGRREITVDYTLVADAPATGPDRIALDRSIDQVVNAYAPPGYTIETLGAQQGSDWTRRVGLPILLLLYAVLAITFESLTMPLLILLAVPLTLFGSTWALVFAGLGVDVIAAIGVIVLLGLTVNPAILLVDRMQQKLLKTGCSGGSAAMTAVRERVRPVLMTSCTTIAGLWPLAIATGAEFEIWPPFATVVMGGLATSTVLTLLVIPVGYVALARLDRIFGRLGVWVILLWAGVTMAIFAPLWISGLITSLNWQLLTLLLIAAALLWLVLRLFHRREPVPMDTSPMVVETRYLSKIYGQPGPVGEAWQRCADYYRKLGFLSLQDRKDRLVVFALLSVASVYLAISLQTWFWRGVFAFVAAAFISRGVIELRQLLGNAFSNRTGRGGVVAAASSGTVLTAAPGKLLFDRVTLTVMPWLALAAIAAGFTIIPSLDGNARYVPAFVPALLAILLLVFQLGRRDAALIANGKLQTLLRKGRLASLRSAWRLFCRNVLGFDLPRREFTALSSVNIRMEPGMIGILGPNGAGKTTLLRLLAAVLDPTSGTVHYGGVERRRVLDQLASVIGYLPQEFGLPGHLTAREYLDYYALLYRVGDKAQRRERVERLLNDVGLDLRQHEKISGFSGGMRQRVAVARTLLREPPVIIVDEPTVGLDPRERIRFRNMLSRLAKGRIVLFSTHVVEDVAVSCQRVLVFKSGSVVFDGTPQALAEQARSLTWELVVAETVIPNIAAQFKIVTQVPDRSGLVRLRLLSEIQPGANANPVESNIEDGYLHLLHGKPTNQGDTP